MYTFVVSIYKVEQYLRQCIESILAQTYHDFEVILVDDGSPDRCPRICDEYAGRDCRVRVIHKQNGGLVSTRKIGLKEPKGQFICYIDGDDYISCDMLETYSKILEQHPADIICAGCTLESGKDRKKKEQNIPAGFYKKDRLRKEVYPQMLSTQQFYSFYVLPSLCMKCFRKEILDKVYPDVPEDITLGEDAAVTYAALLEASSVYAADYFGYIYRHNTDSMTNAYDEQLHGRIDRLLCWLKTIKSSDCRNFDEQLEMYSLLLLKMAVNNELFFNRKNSFKIRRKNLLGYLNDEIFDNALQRVPAANIKDRFEFFCLRHRFVCLLYVVIRVIRKL